MDSPTPSLRGLDLEHTGELYPPSRRVFEITVVASIFVLLAILPGEELESGPERMVRIASQKLLTTDPRFHPADHYARVYSVCSRSPSTVDFSRRSEGRIVPRGPVVARVHVKGTRSIQNVEFFTKEEQVESNRTGHLFRLMPNGSVDVRLEQDFRRKPDGSEEIWIDDN